MNYIWELLIGVKQKELNPNDMHYFASGNTVSPYLELIMNISNRNDIDKEVISGVEVNVYHRFLSIFNKLLLPDYKNNTLLENKSVGLLNDSDEAENIVNETNISKDISVNKELNENDISTNKDNIVGKVTSYDSLEIEEENEEDKKGVIELRDILTDIILHHMADVDLRSFMNRNEYYIKFLISDMENGAFGNEDDFRLFSLVEKRFLVRELLSMYKTMEYMSSLKNIGDRMFPYAQVYIRDNEEIVFYMREPKDEELEKKLNYVIKLFVPIDVKHKIHWMITYGIIGFENTIKVEEFIV